MGRSRGMAVAVAGGVAVVAARRRHLRWGATDEEVGAVLPGDELLDPVDLVATRAVTITALRTEVWPWLAQMGQGRGGLYSYDVLENLLGCDIHSADRIVPEWQGIKAGDQVRLHPELPLVVAVVQPGRALVLRSGPPAGRGGAPYEFTWAFVLGPAPSGRTRLVVRERYRYRRPWAALVAEPVALAGFVMTERMLRGIRRRAEDGGGERP